MSLNKLKKIYEKIVSGPVKPMKWQDIETLLLALGAKQRKGDGSGRVFIINKRPLVIHKPHPDNELKKYAIRLVRDYLIKNQIKLKQKEEKK